MSELQAKFEAFANEKDSDLAYTHNDFGTLIYLNPYTDELWRAYQAGAQAQASIAQPVPEPVGYVDEPALKAVKSSNYVSTFIHRKREEAPPEQVAIYTAPIPASLLPQIVEALEVGKEHILNAIDEYPVSRESGYRIELSKVESAIAALKQLEGGA